MDASEIQVGTTLYVNPTFGKRRETTPGTTAVKFVFGGLLTDLSGPVTTLDLQGRMGTNGWFVGDVTVTISATDPPDVGFSGVAAIHYILDGGAERIVAVNPPTKTATISVAHDQGKK